MTSPTRTRPSRRPASSPSTTRRPPGTRRTRTGPRGNRRLHRRRRRCSSRREPPREVPVAARAALRVPRPSAGRRPLILARPVQPPGRPGLRRLPGLPVVCRSRLRRRLPRPVRVRRECLPRSVRPVRPALRPHPVRPSLRPGRSPVRRTLLLRRPLLRPRPRPRPRQQPRRLSRLRSRLRRRWASRWSYRGCPRTAGSHRAMSPRSRIRANRVRVPAVVTLRAVPPCGSPPSP